MELELQGTHQLPILGPGSQLGEEGFLLAAFRRRGVNHLADLIIHHSIPLDRDTRSRVQGACEHRLVEEGGIVRGLDRVEAQ